MYQARRRMSMLPHEEEVLRTLYREFNIPTDQFPQRSDDLTRLTESWNSLTGRSETGPELLRYMINRRKNKKWEKLGRSAAGEFSRQRVALSEIEIATLDAIHEQLQIASDQYALNVELADTLQEEFAKRTGRIIPAMILAAEMITRRKAGALATLRPKIDEQDVGFADIGKVGS